jgi:hypothetical protein
LYEQHVYPKMGPHQKALFVPPAYGCNGTKCSNQLCCSNSTRDGANVPCNGDCTVAMLQWAKGVYAWARSDPRIGRLRQTHHTPCTPYAMHTILTLRIHHGTQHTLYSHTLRIHPTYTLIRPTHTVMALLALHTVLILYSYCTHTALVLCSYRTHAVGCTHPVLTLYIARSILYAYCTRTP